MNVIHIEIMDVNHIREVKGCSKLKSPLLLYKLLLIALFIKYESRDVIIISILIAKIHMIRVPPITGLSNNANARKAIKATPVTP